MGAIVEAIGAGTVKAAIKAGNLNGVGSRGGCHDVADLRRLRTGAGTQTGTVRSLQPEPRPEIVMVDNLADMESDAVTGSGSECPGIHFARRINGARIQKAIDQGTAVRCARRGDGHGIRRAVEGSIVDDKPDHIGPGDVRSQRGRSAGRAGEGGAGAIRR